MDWPVILGTIAALLFLVGTLIAVYLILRLRKLYRRVGSFECSLSEGTDRTWRSGIGIFGARYLTWYPVVSLSRKAVHSFSRERLRVVDHHQKDTESGTLVLHLKHNERDILMATTQESFAALASWMDAAPPSEEPTSY